MEELEKIKEALLKSHRMICKSIDFNGGHMYFYTGYFTVYVSKNSYSCRVGYSEVGITNFSVSGISMSGYLNECAKIVKQMKKHKLLLEYIKENKIEVKHE